MHVAVKFYIGSDALLKMGETDNWRRTRCANSIDTAALARA